MSSLYKHLTLGNLVAFGTGMAFTLMLLVSAYKSIMHEEEAALSVKFGVARGSLVEKISAAHEVLNSLKLQFNLSSVDADQFRILSEDALQLHSYIKSVKYYALVKDDDRADFESSLRQEGYSTFAITVDKNQQYLPAQRSTIYFPLVFQEPFNPVTVRAMGSDALANKDLQPYFEAAIDSSKPVQAVSDRSYLIIRAIYAGKEEASIKGVNERRKMVNGIVSIEIDAQTLLPADYLQDLISLTLQTEDIYSNQSTIKVLSYTTDLNSGNRIRLSAISGSRNIVMGGRNYELKINRALYWKSTYFPPLLGAVLGGSFLTVLLLFLARAISSKAVLLQHRNKEIQNIVEARTHELAFERDRAQVTLESIAEAVITTDKLGMIEYMNPVAEQLMGWSAQAVIGKPIFNSYKVIDEQTREELNSSVQLCLANGESMRRQESALLISHDGNSVAINESVAPIFDKDGQISGAVLIFHDVSVMRTLTRQIYHQATHDTLTGLPNRLLLKERIEIEISRARRDNKKVAVMFVDLDRFKLVNDSLGHAVGDELLQQVAARFSDCARDTDIVSRLGGDEFVVVMGDIFDINQAEMMADRLLKSLRQPFMHELHEFYVGASIGISLFPDSGETSEDLMTHADIAMYRVKEQGKNSYLIFNPATDSKGKPRFSMEAELRHAIERKQLILHYQPQIETMTGRIVGVEALVRWNHPAKGMVSPAEFIPLAEESGLIVEIGNWVMYEACRQNKSWQDMGLPRISMAVNLAHRQFFNANLISGVQRTLDETGLDAEFLDIELTEGILAENATQANARLTELKALGVHLSIDDFGTGYSSLAYLKNFPIDMVKIDRCFVKDIESDSKDAEICMAIIAMTHSLKLKVVAEGVETIAQHDFLRSKGCDIIQGFLFSKPLNALLAEDFLRQYQNSIGASGKMDTYINTNSNLNHTE